MIKLEEKLTNKIPGITSLKINADTYSQELFEIIRSCNPFYHNKKTNEFEIPTTRLAKFVNQATKLDEVQLKVKKQKSQENDKIFELATYKTKPYQYQLEGIQYGLNHNNWLLLDCPGLGKTLQMIYLAQELKSKKGLEHCLIICGINTLKTNWEKEIQKHSGLDCVVLGKRINSKGKIVYTSIPKRVEQLSKPISEFFVIMNVETLRSNEILNILKKGPNKFDMIVFDEVHKCKGHNSQQSKNLLSLNTATYKIGLTGTPILNSPLDAYVPLKWLGIENSTYTNFKNYYCSYGGLFNNQFLGYKNLDVLKEQLENNSLRRTKDLLDLPEKTIIDEVLEMNDRQEIFYQNIVDGVLDEVNKVEIKNPSNLLSLITRLRQATACPEILTTEKIESVKLERCKELIEEITSNGDKVVVFSTFKEPLNQLVQDEKMLQYNPLLCTGDIDDSIISENIDKFQNQTENKVMLCTQAKMGTGITLTAASYAIFLDLAWTSGVNEQCEDRIHRIGSKKPVFIYRLHCDNTFDIRVKQLVENKEAIGDYIVDNIQDENTTQLLMNMIFGLKT